MYIEVNRKQVNKIRKEKKPSAKKLSLLAFLLALSCLCGQQFGGDVRDYEEDDSGALRGR